MKNKIAIAFLCASSILFFCCKKNVQKVDIGSNGVKNITLSSIEESFQDTSYFKNPQIVVLETLDKSLLTGIKRIFMDDNKLFIYDKKLHSILMFDISGKYISKIDCKGQGPGEYTQLTDFTIDTTKKQIILLCDAPYKRMYFNYDGIFVNEERDPDFYFRLTADSNYIYFERDVLGMNDCQLQILDIKTRKMKEGLEPINIENNYYAYGNSFSRGKDILYVRRYDNTIYELRNGEIIKKYHVDFKKHSFPDKLKEEKKTETIIDECSAHEYIFSMSNVLSNDNYMMFNTNMGIFIYDKKNDALTGYKQMVNTKYNPVFEYPFIHYIPLENANKIVCYIDEPLFIKHIATQVVENPDNIKIKNMKSKYPKLIKDIIDIGVKITEDSNPVLFIYELKD